MRDPGSDHEYVVLVSHWDDGWDVFVLDPSQGLVGATKASTLAEVDDAAHATLCRWLGRPPRRFKLTVIRN